MGNSADIRLTERSWSGNPPKAEERMLPAHVDHTVKGSSPKQPADMTLEELFARFERDMTYDAHSYAIRYPRSAARREIQRRSTDSGDKDATHKVIFAIVAYLRSGKSLQETMCRDYVDGGWAVLMAAIARREPMR